MICSLRHCIIVLVFMFSLIYGNCESNQALNSNEKELTHKLGRILEESDLETSESDANENINSLLYPDVPDLRFILLKRALPRMGKRTYYVDKSDEETPTSNELFEFIEKRALPRMGRALPRMGRALPRMGRALPRMGRTLPRMG